MRFFLLMIFIVVLIVPANEAMAQGRSQSFWSWKGDETLFDFTNESRWITRLRLITVDPETRSTTTIQGDVHAGRSFTPEVDFTYFFTDNVAAELILAISEHNMGAVNTTSGNLDFGEVLIVPPTLTLQYHFIPDGTIRPYVGAGVNYTIFLEENPVDVNSIKYEDSFGYAFQAGVDFGIDEHWALNFDVKRIYVSPDVSINGGAITADVDLDPWVVGAGIAYRF